MSWPIIFLLVVLKIPIAWVAWVVWRAIKDVPEPLDGVLGEGGIDRDQGPGWSRRRFRPNPFRRGPHGAPSRTYARRGGTPARAEAGSR